MEGTPSAGPPRAAGRKEQITDTKASVPRRRPSQSPTTPSLTCLWLGKRPQSTDPHCPVGPVGTPGQRPRTRQDAKSLGVHQRTEEGAQRCSNIEISRSHKIRIPEASFCILFLKCSPSRLGTTARVHPVIFARKEIKG